MTIVLSVEIDTIRITAIYADVSLIIRQWWPDNLDVEI